MRRESSASAPPIGMRSGAPNAVQTTTTPRSGGSEAFYDEGEKNHVGTTTMMHRRSVSVTVGDDDERKIAELLAIKREFARTKSLSFDRRGARGDDKLEDGLSSSKTTTTMMMSKTTSDDYDATCPTCFEEYDEENPRITLGCGHHFHLPCVLEWREYLELQGREDTCPVCDAPIVLDGF